MSERKFSAVVESRSAIRSIWVVSEITAKGVGEPAYRATTYPDSELLSLETFKTGRPISTFMGRNLRPGIKAAIDAFESKQADGDTAQGKASDAS